MELRSSFERSITFSEWDSNVVVHQSLWRDVCNQIVQSSGSEIKIEPPRDANASMHIASFTRETAFDATFTSKTIWYVVSSVIGAMLGKYSACVKHEQARKSSEDAKQVLGPNSLGPVKSYPFLAPLAVLL